MDTESVDLRAPAAGSLPIGAEDKQATNREPPDAADVVQSIKLFDDYGLADLVAEITGKNSRAADELAMYLLIIVDGLNDDLGGEIPARVRRALERAVELAFQFTETYQAALELYTLGQRGYLTGHLSAKELIRELIASRACT